jgi:hypothetical protein
MISLKHPCNYEFREPFTLKDALGPDRLEGKQMRDTKVKVYDLADGDISVWVDPGGAICLKLNGEFNDPVELAEHEALDLANLLISLAEKGPPKFLSSPP